MVFMFQIAGVNIMANEISGGELQPRQWLMYWSGGWEFGDYGISINDAGRARLTLFSTTNESNAGGAGIVEAQEGLYDRDAANKVRLALCDPSNQAGRGLQFALTDPPAMFGASCDVDGHIQERTGHIAMLPKNLFDIAGEGVGIIQANLLDSGVKRIWINASVRKIERRDKYFLVTIRMINSGRDEISFRRPDLWSGRFREETMSIGAINTNPKEDGGWRFELAGQPLANKAEFDTEYVTLQGGTHRDFVFEAVPYDKYKAGIYAFSLDAWMDIDWKDHGENQRSHVDFYSGQQGRTVITIDRDYPSTPREREQWEATHRADMSFRPVKPGEAFAEDGLYRAERLISGGTYRSLQVMPFKAGDIAATDAVKMPMESGDDVHINGPVQWLWEGSAPQPVKPFATEYVEGTQHHCALGTSCPHSGRWVARTLSGRNALYPDYRYDLSYTITLQRGQTMPSVQNKGDKTEWKWMGGLT